MNAEELRNLQAPFKARYKENAASAQKTLTAQGTLDAGLVCNVAGFKAPIPVGLHEFAGGDGLAACAGNMLLEALVGCTGVTLCAVATALGITIRGGQIRAEGDMDFRGTLGVSKDVPVGFTDIRLTIKLDADADQEKIDNLVRLTKRYCVVFQTLEKPPRITTAAGVDWS